MFKKQTFRSKHYDPLKKFMIIVMLLPLAVFSQTTIPIPPGIGNGNEIVGSQAIGDFDGDGSDDVAVFIYDTANGNPNFSIFSFKKNTHLLVIERNNGIHTANGDPIDKYAHDFDGDGTVELLIDDKIYSFTNVGIKKKLP